jgi:acetyl/propionyl-CoA carboxylase alpha subunit
MLAKLIVRGSDRLDAIHRADQALRETVLLGCRTNIAFLRRLIAHPAFLAGDVHTGFLEENRQIAAEAATPVSKLQALLAAAALSTRPLVEGADAVPKLHAAMGSWCN